MTLDILIKERDLRVVLEPVVSVRQKTILGRVARIKSGVEPAGSLSRSLAGRDGFSVDFDRWYRGEALSAYKKAGANGLLFLGFETAVLDMAGVAGSGHLANRVKELDLNPADIVISIRESKVEDRDLLIDFVARHRAQGFLIALKELGEGHSNLERVAALRPDMLQVGEGLVTRLDKEFFAQEILKSLAALSKKIGALLVAEGVATENQALAALDNGVDLLEGPYFSGRAGSVDAIARLADRHRDAAVEKSKALKKRVRESESILSTFVRALTGITPAELDTALARLVRDNTDVECAFVLSESGVQETDTHARPGVVFKRNALFHPARPGADHSGKEYVYLLSDAFVSRYRTEPYVSQASGNLCVTLSALLRDQSGHTHILCLDLPWQ